MTLVCFECAYTLATLLKKPLRKSSPHNLKRSKVFRRNYERVCLHYYLLYTLRYTYLLFKVKTANLVTLYQRLNNW